VAFAENALLKSSGIICWSPLSSLLPEELSMDKTTQQWPLFNLK
jgi:hypothetical protein